MGSSPRGFDGADKQRAETEAYGHRGDGFFRRVELIGPAHHHDDRTGGAERREVEPAPMQRHGDEPDIEQGDVAEQAAGIVDAGGEQFWRKKTTENSEDGDHLRLQPYGEDERGRRDQRHE